MKIGFFSIAVKAEKWRLYPWLKSRGPVHLKNLTPIIKYDGIISSHQFSHCTFILHTLNVCIVSFRTDQRLVPIESKPPRR